MNFKPLNNKVLLEKIVDDKITESGLYVPEEKSYITKGKVLAVGDGKIVNGTKVPVDVNVGDTVLYGKAVEVRVDGKTYYSVEIEDIFGILL